MQKSIVTWKDNDKASVILNLSWARSNGWLFEDNEEYSDVI